MVAWRAMSRPRVGAAALVPGAVAAGATGAGLFAGDSVWTGIALLLLAGGWSALALGGRAATPAGGGPLLGLLLATTAWSGLSLLWSVAPDSSWAELDRTLVLSGFLALGLLLGASGPAACRTAAGVLLAALGAAVLWALAGKAIPALFPDGGRTTRLRDPIGYWNALALAADFLLVLALGAAAGADRSRVARTGGAVLAYAAVVAILLAASRVGVAAALLGVALLLLLRRDRVETALLALATTAPGVAVAGWAFTRPALVEDGQAHADRVADGAWFGVLLLAGGALVAFLSLVLARRSWTGATRKLVARTLAGLALAATLGAAVAALANAGRIADEFRGGEVTNEPGRLADLSSNNRLDWWGEAWEVFRADPLLGAGANTFEVARKRYRETASPVTQPHSVPLQFLAGTGLVGLALFAALVAAAAAAAAGALRRLDAAERTAAGGLAIGLVLWLAHAVVDYTWDFVAVTGPAVFAAGVLAAAGRPVRRVRAPLVAAGAAALALSAVAAVATPWLAERSVREVGPALERRDFDAAAESVERARSLDPLSLEPLFALARVEEQRGSFDAALDAYRKAVRLQPKNPETWYQLGLYEFDRGDRCSAYVHLNEAYTLDPSGRQWVPGGPLVQALEWVNQPGSC